jgi:hypothetical protein
VAQIAARGKATPDLDGLHAETFSLIAACRLLDLDVRPLTVIRCRITEAESRGALPGWTNAELTQAVELAQGLRAAVEAEPATAAREKEEYGAKGKA